MRSTASKQKAAMKADSKRGMSSRDLPTFSEDDMNVDNAESGEEDNLSDNPQEKEDFHSHEGSGSDGKGSLDENHSDEEMEEATGPRKWV